MNLFYPDIIELEEIPVTLKAGILFLCTEIYKQHSKERKPFERSGLFEKEKHYAVINSKKAEKFILTKADCIKWLVANNIVLEDNSYRENDYSKAYKFTNEALVSKPSLYQLTYNEDERSLLRKLKKEEILKVDSFPLSIQINKCLQQVYLNETKFHEAIFDAELSGNQKFLLMSLYSKSNFVFRDKTGPTTNYRTLG